MNCSRLQPLFMSITVRIDGFGWGVWLALYDFWWWICVILCFFGRIFLALLDYLAKDNDIGGFIILITIFQCRRFT